MDDELMFGGTEEEEPVAEGPTDSWRVLIVDDDPEIHAVTRLLLGDTRYVGKTLNLASAFNCDEAMAYLLAHPDTALIILDIVMEEDDSGLQLINFIRGSLANEEVQIVLRTGQPGQAPEREVISKYDINGYFLKTEITTQKMYSLVVTALRTYHFITKMKRHREGLEKIVEATSQMLAYPSLPLFCEGVLLQVSAFLDCNPDGILCLVKRADGGDPSQFIEILAACGHFVSQVGRRLSDLRCEDYRCEDIRETVLRTLREKQNHFSSTASCLYLKNASGCELAIYLNTSRPIEAKNKDLVALFCSRVAEVYQRMEKIEPIRDSEKDRI